MSNADDDIPQRRASDRDIRQQIRLHIHIAYQIIADDYGISAADVRKIINDVVESYARKQRRHDWVGSSFAQALMTALIAIAGGALVIIWQHLTGK